MAGALKILLVLTVLSLGPALLIAVTSFTRIIIVLSMVRHALGMQETPPNIVLISLALFLTSFVMMPVFKQVNEQAWDAVRQYAGKQCCAGQGDDPPAIS